MRQTKIIWLLCLCFLVAGQAVLSWWSDWNTFDVEKFARSADGAPRELKDEPDPLLGTRAPDFSLHDLDGDTLHLSDFKDRVPVVLEFGSLT